MFDTYGPFLLKTHDSDALDELFRQIRRSNEELQYGIGVYLVFALDSSGEMKPWYVGRTWREFGWRILDHYKTGRFEHLADRGPITFFLLPRITRQGKIIRKSGEISQSMAKSIRYLELILIGTCLNLNPDILNIQEAGFHNSLNVPGYIDGGATEREPAARTLSKLLKN
jgi:hypothetical protein